MRNYDFHELLSASEFQQFAKSVLEIKENKKVKSNPMTKDGGIDLYYLDENTIVQVKNYQNKATQVLSELKKEMGRIKELNPERYIIITAAEIGKEKREKLIKMFEGYLQKEDIIDKNDLNDLLSKSKYHDLEIETLKLLVPNSFVLSHYLNKIENNKIYTATEIELNKMKEEKKLFSVNEVFFEALEKVSKEKTVMITGEPGVGKSILGRMLVSYFINTHPNIEFFSISSLDELFQIYNKEKKQIYFFDDFWGDTEYNFNLTEKEKDQLIHFIKCIKELENTYLIMTTREYILKEGLERNQKLQSSYKLYQFSINLKEVSETAKFNILANHLKQANLEWNHLKVLLDYYPTIIENENYNPRYLSLFFLQYHENKSLKTYDFFNKTLDYLNNPYDFWKETLENQPLEVILSLMLLSLNQEQLSIEALHKKYNNLMNLKIMNSSRLIEFKDLIKRMDNEFTITRQSDNEKLITITFKNPSYKDFIKTYLKNNMASYITFIYHPHLSNDELISLWRILNEEFELFKELKETKEIDYQIIQRLKNQSLSENDNTLIELGEITDLSHKTEVGTYLISFVEENLEDFEDILYNGAYFGLVIALLSTMANKYDFSVYIENILKTLVCEEDLFLTEKIATIKELYPDIYSQFCKEYKYEIKKCLYDSFNKSRIECEQEQDSFALELMKFDEIPTLYKRLNLKPPVQLLNEINESIIKLETEYKPKRIKTNNYKKAKQKIKKEEDKSVINEKINELIGNNEKIYNTEKVLKQWKISLEVKKKILKLKEDVFFSDFIYYEKILSLLCDYFSNHEISNDTFKVLEEFEQFIIKKENLTITENQILYCIASSMIANQKLIIKKTDLIPYCNRNKDKIINSSFFKKRGEWYHFIHPIIGVHFALNYFKEILNKKINLENFVSKLLDINEDWKELNFEVETITLFTLIKKIFPNQWESELRKPAYIDFLKAIKSTNSVEIAKSILKTFNLKYEFHKDGGAIYSFDNYFLHDLIKMDFSLEIFELFLWDFSYPDEEIEEFFNKITDNGKLEVNKALRKKTFINEIKDNGTIETLNKLYLDLLKEFPNLEKPQEEIKETVEV